MNRYRHRLRKSLIGRQVKINWKYLGIVSKNEIATVNGIRILLNPLGKKFSF